MSVPTQTLPKWPALAVSGATVSSDQAAEIIVRTSGLHFGTNDHDWERALYEAAGITLDSEKAWVSVDWDSVRAARERYAILDLEYLKNDERIASSYIGGPHGWCNWDGRISAGSYNIGKWPSVEGVLDEWRAIAIAFPYLNLRCQLYSGESCEEGITPLVEYAIHDGTATVEPPMTPIPVRGDVDSMLLLMRLPVHIRERGCTINDFKRGLAIAEAAKK